MSDLEIRSDKNDRKNLNRLQNGLKQEAEFLTLCPLVYPKYPSLTKVNQGVGKLVNFAKGPNYHRQKIDFELAWFS